MTPRRGGVGFPHSCEESNTTLWPFGSSTRVRFLMQHPWLAAWGRQSGQSGRPRGGDLSPRMRVCL